MSDNTQQGEFKSPTTESNFAVNETVKKAGISPGLLHTLKLSTAFLIPTLLLSIVYIYIYFRPQNVVDRSLIRTSALNYFTYTGRIVVGMQGEFSLISILIPNSYAATADVAGSVDWSDKKYPRVLANVNVLLQGMFKGDAELRFYPSKFYLKAKSFPDFGVLNSEGYLNKWFLFNISQEKNSRNKANPSDPFGERPIKVVRNLGKGSVEGADTFQYEYVINKDAFFKLIKFIYEDSGNVLSDADQKTIDKLKSRLNFSEGVIWIDRKSFVVRRFTLNAKLLPFDPENSKVIDISADITLKEFNIPLNVPEPEQAETIEQMLQLNSPI